MTAILYSWRFVSSHIADLLLHRYSIRKMHKNSNHPYCRCCRFIFLSIGIRSSAEVSSRALSLPATGCFWYFHQSDIAYILEFFFFFRFASQVVVDDATDARFVAGMLKDVCGSLHLPLHLLKQWNCVHPQHDRMWRMCIVRMNAASWKSCTALFNRCSLIAFSN